MEAAEREEILSVLREELQEFFVWVMEEIGGEYYLEDPAETVQALEETVRTRIGQRIDTERARLWERDRHALFDHPDRPSVFRLMEAEDLQIIHYREDVQCDHFKVLGRDGGAGGEPGAGFESRYEQSFGILLVSESAGWMYRLDMCEVCGLVEIWSMAYSEPEMLLCAEPASDTEQ